MASTRKVNWVGWLFILVGVVALFGFGGDILTGLSSYGLTSTRAVISSSRIGSVTSTDADGTVVTDDTAMITFRYWVGDTEHSGRAVYLADPTPKTSVFLNAQVMVREYAPATETRAYYDPDDVSRACLRRGLGPSGFALIGFLLFLFGMGAFMLLWGTKQNPGRWYGRSKKRKRSP